MEVIQSWPPNIEKIRVKLNPSKHTCFAYGDKLYSPSGVDIQKHLMVHEETHSRQQAEMGVEKWWERYIDDAEFRVSQELEAYQNQYAYVYKHHRGESLPILRKLASDFSGPLYGNAIGYPEAFMAILKSGK